MQALLKGWNAQFLIDWGRRLLTHAEWRLQVLSNQTWGFQWVQQNTVRLHHQILVARWTFCGFAHGGYNFSKVCSKRPVQEKTGLVLKWRTAKQLNAAEIHGECINHCSWPVNGTNPEWLWIALCNVQTCNNRAFSLLSHGSCHTGLAGWFDGICMSFERCVAVCSCLWSKCRSAMRSKHVIGR